MHMMVRTSALGAALALIVAGAVLLSGCGGSDEATVTGGTISGSTIDGISGLALGGVNVAVVAGGQAYGADSSYPSGAFSISGVPAGSYSSVVVTPPPDVYGSAWTVHFTPAIRVSDGGTVALSAPILIVADPPAVP
jgi:hypothetical protein